jgi:signal transduction histidine kinase
VILLMFAIAVGELTARRVHADFDNQVAATANALANNLNASYDPATGVVTVSPPLYVYTSNHAVVRLLAEDGTVIRTAPRSAPNLGLPFASTANVAGYRVETRRVFLATGGYMYVQYARPLSDPDQTVSRLRLFLLFGVLGGTGLAFGAGAMIARRAMAPIAALTATAREIERTRDPNRGLPSPTTNDEIATLSRTLEGMLRALADARADTEAALERQREFIADASHELRTPLTSVLANLELLTMTLDGEQGEAARAALRSSQRMRRLVADLLLLARADVGREEGAPAAPRSHRPLDLADIVIEAASELEPLSSDHVIELDPRPAPLQGAGDDLQRLAINLMENAVRHTPPGTHVTVSTRTLPGDRVELAVEDDGPGVPSQLEQRLFERFVRGSGDSAGSFGLGLAIVRAVADAHAGTVRYERSAGGGARFVVTLPGEPVAPRVAPPHLVS